jgi:TolB-like protein/Tfp pilus assembly protein PilF
MEEELGVEPALETQDLAVRIKLASAAPGPQVPAAAHPAPRALRPLTLLAVLPFERLGAGDIPDYTILGMLDQITCKMAAFQSPAVVSYNSTRHLLGKPVSVTEIGRDMGAAYVLTGTLRFVDEAQSRLLLSVQLCDGANNRVHWATSLEVLPADLISASGQLAEDIVQAIEPSLNLAELERARLLPIEAQEPHHLVLQAKDLMFGLTVPEFAQARRMLDEALSIGPNFAAAHALLAEWHGIELWQGWSADPRRTRAALELHSRRAINLSPMNGRALAQWGHHLITLNRDFDGALAAFDAALRFCPSDAEALIWTVPTLAHAGEGERALQNGERAVRLSPFDPFQYRNEHFLSLAHYACGQYEEAARLGMSSYEGRPNYGSNLRVTMAALMAMGAEERARDLAQQHNRAEPGYSLRAVQSRMGFRDTDEQALYVQRLMQAGVRL